MPTPIAPNLFELAGASIAVTYSTTSLDGKPRLTFKKGRKTLTFAGKEITATETGIGKLVTVLIAATPDKDSTTFAILLPGILLADRSRKASFRTIGVTTVTKTSITGRPIGVQQTYKVVELQGAARKVDF